MEHDRRFHPGGTRDAAGRAPVPAPVTGTARTETTAPDPWQSQRDGYHCFTVPKIEVPSSGDSAGAGVEVEGDFGPAKTWAAAGLGGDGADWGTVIGPLEPGVYTYRYVATMADRSKVVFREPGKPVDVTSNPELNTLFVPGPEVAWMDDVVAGGGTLSELDYRADGADRTAVVWTPPDYTDQRAHAHPVLYLLADEGQSAREWLELGRASQVLDNLAVAGDLASPVVVMAYADSATEVADALVPAVRQAYHVSTAVQRTGVAGIGRGAELALELALTAPGVFGTVGSLSGALPDGTDVTAAQARQFNATTDLLRFYVGNTLDPRYNATVAAMETLRAAGVRFEFDGVHPETGGVWDTWRENLRDFAARAFQPSVADHGPSAGHRAEAAPYTAPATGSITTPHIDADGMVAFETGTQWADAKDVVLWGDWAPNGQWFRIPLTKVGDRWRTAIGPIDGYYYWRYEVDGVGFHDPHDTANTVNLESQLFVPGGVRTPLLADAPAGQVGRVDAVDYAGTLGSTTLRVWTPADFDPDRAEPYPVLYLYHGYAQNAAAWTEVGRAAQILDNLYAAGDIEPVVVVMPGYADAPSDVWGDLAGEVMPLIEAEYHASADPSRRGLAGLSWGGMLTYNTLVNHPGRFAHYGIFSPPFSLANLDPSTPGGQLAIATTKSVTLFAGDLDGGAVDAIDAMESALTGNGVPTTKTIVRGPHGFDVWWQGLADFLPRAFRSDRREPLADR